jgi:hypothetical protein
MNAPAIKLQPLWDVQVLVEDDHAARRRFSVLATNASRASSTASAIAS